MSKPLTIYWSVFDLAAKEIILADLQKEAEVPDLWQDSEKAQRLMKEISALKEEVEEWQTLRQTITDTLELAQLEDESIYSDLDRETLKIEAEVSKREFEAKLSGPYDRGDALLAIHAGAGGTDSQDWAEMLQRMYLRWTEHKGYKTDILDFTFGEEAGIKSVTISIEGRYAYGYLRSEKGVHRLVRLSPFDAAHRRHTSFAMVEILPQVEEDSRIEINADDLRIDVFRSSGAGGQNVQKNATAIRITHFPTGIVVSCLIVRGRVFVICLLIIRIILFRVFAIYGIKSCLNFIDKTLIDIFKFILYCVLFNFLLWHFITSH